MLSDTVDLSPQSWDLAHGIAMTLAKERVDVDELSKCIAYLRSVAHHPDAGSRFFRFTGELVRETGLHRSNETPRYYRLIDQTCKKYLQSLQDRPAEMLQILGWAARLARYYKDGGVPIGEIPSPPDPNGGRPTHSRGGEAKPQPEALRPKEQPEQKQAQPQVENAAASTKARFKIGQHLKASITNIKGNEVTFQIVNTNIKLTQKEPKRAGSLTVGQEVEVEVLDLREDGRVRRVRLL
ncbi:hypothetical protein SYN63AY4M2_03265 [Synechococcus sp. 63AY4M2]|jgi:hypothetical protein|uniref:hypothetical protein n=1 Tax=Synechococcus sp. 63AY4M2 TaxID=1353266 RepID=UPI000C17C34C|nr:hypothetical protein [Synechococcus sp. 63AY4M2]PIK85545.1 hypothetical protein SYN63AY4M2_03265 [Synechococcus sp. 63AY4M2]